MKDVSGVKWAVQGGHVGLFGPYLGRRDTIETPDTFNLTPGCTPDAPEEVADDGKPVSSE